MFCMILEREAINRCRHRVDKQSAQVADSVSTRKGKFRQEAWRAQDGTVLTNRAHRWPIPCQHGRGGAPHGRHGGHTCQRRVDKQSAQVADSASTRQAKHRLEGMEGTCQRRVDKQSAQMANSVSTRQRKHRLEAKNDTCQHPVDKQSAQMANSASTRQRKHRQEAWRAHASAVLTNRVRKGPIPWQHGLHY